MAWRLLLRWPSIGLVLNGCTFKRVTIDLGEEFVCIRCISVELLDLFETAEDITSWEEGGAYGDRRVEALC